MLAPRTPKQNCLLVVLVRPKLKARVCESYAVVKRESDRWLSRKTAVIDQLS
jgi:hypothetical protein